MPRALPALPPCGSSLDCAQPFTYRAIPRFRKKTSPKKVIPRLRSNRQGIFEFPPSCHSTAFFPSCHSGPFFLSVTPACFFICHSGLFFYLSLRPPRRNNRPPYRVIPRLRSNRQGIYEFPPSCHSTAFFPSCHSGPFFLSVTPACFFICHSGPRAGVQVNIDSLTAWIPGQARNDSYMSVIAYSTLGRDLANL